MTPTVLLSFDAEEFDIPLEYGRGIDPAEQFRIGGEGIARALTLLKETRVRGTFFVTASMAERRPDLVRWMIADGHEVASHSLAHSGFEPDHPAKSRAILERLSGKEVRGFRMPRLAPISLGSLRDAGYVYDASLNPIWLPGRYNKLGSPRRTHVHDGLVIIPAATTPIVRWPLFWLAFKNQPRWLNRLCVQRALRSGPVALYFHPWELTSIRGYGLPRSVTRLDGAAMMDALREQLLWIGRRARFRTYLEHALEFRAGNT
jgi:hypothetical protein